MYWQSQYVHDIHTAHTIKDWQHIKNSCGIKQTMWRAGNRVSLFTLHCSFASSSVRLQWYKNEGFVHCSDIQNFLKDTTLTEWVQNLVADQEQIECSPWPTRVTLLVREGGGFGGRAYSYHWLGIQRDLMQQQMQIPGSFDTTGCCAAPLREQKALPEMQLPQSSCSCGSMIHLEGMGAWLGKQPESIFYKILKHRFFFFLKANQYSNMLRNTQKSQLRREME